MRDFALNKVDSEDIGDFIKSVEKSFVLKFVESDFAEVENLGDLCDAIIKKIDLEDSESCTRQQAFYKLRASIVLALNKNPKTISANTSLEEIFPRANRRKNFLKVEEKLGFKMSALNPPGWLMLILAVIFIASVVYIYFDWKIGISSLILSIVAFKLAIVFGKELNVKTVGELSKKVSTENYLMSRRNPTTVNRKEIEQLLIEWFYDEFEFAFNK